MDKDVEQLLESWELSEYIHVFAENTINRNTLNLVDEDVIKELIQPVGDRVHFKQNLTQWIELTNPPPVVEPQPSCSTPSTHDHNDTLEDITNLILVPPSQYLH